MSFVRTLILNSVNKDSKKAVVTLTNINERCSGEIKLYNFEKPATNTALGINTGREVIKVPLDFNENNCSFKTQKHINLNDKLTLALVDLSQVRYPEIILGGTSNFSGDFWAVEAAFAPPQVSGEVLYENVDDDVEKLIDEEMEEELICDKCPGCPYKEAFFEEPANNKDKKPEIKETKEDKQEEIAEIKKDEVIDETIEIKNNGFNDLVNDELDNAFFEKFEENIKHENGIENNDKISLTKALAESKTVKANDAQISSAEEESSFYQQIKPQVDQLFLEYQKESKLEELIPNSKWAKINYEKDDNYYVLGLIYEGENIRYIAYGLPTEDSSTPPQDLQQYAQFLPLDLTDANGKGYWIVYQDATSGESVEMNVI